MTGSGWLVYGVLALLVAERGIELRIARRNERWIRAAGGHEVDAAFTRWIVAFHALWFAAFLAEAVLRGAEAQVSTRLVVFVLLALQSGRYWCIRSLGKFWNTKVLVLPGAAPVRSGPYAWLKHPNYLIVAVEIFLYPVLFGCWLTAFAGGTLNLLILRRRIRLEEAALEKDAG